TKMESSLSPRPENTQTLPIQSLPQSPPRCQGKSGCALGCPAGRLAWRPGRAFGDIFLDEGMVNLVK
ncbi:MAG: hypothetical protein ACYS74_18245, partial [Planctomycetota bacterium]